MRLVSLNENLFFGTPKKETSTLWGFGKKKIQIWSQEHHR
jgi:hypothetical protein